MKDVNNNLLENSEDSRKRKRDESSDDEGSVKKQKLISKEEESSDSQSNNSRDNNSQDNNSQDNDSQDNNSQDNNNISDTQADNAGQSNSLDQQDNDNPESDSDSSSELSESSSESSSDDETDSETEEGFNEIQSLHGSSTRDYMSNLINSFKQARRSGDEDRLNIARFDLRNYRNHWVERLSKSEDYDSEDYSDSNAEGNRTAELRRGLEILDRELHKSGAGIVTNSLVGDPFTLVDDDNSFMDGGE